MFGVNRIWSSFEENYMQVECSVEVENVCFKYYSPLVHSQKEWSLTMYVYTGGVRRTQGSGQGHWKSVRVGSRPQNRWLRTQGMTLSCKSAAHGGQEGEAVQVQSPRISSAPCSSSLFHVVALSLTAHWWKWIQLPCPVLLRKALEDAKPKVGSADQVPLRWLSLDSVQQ